MNNLKHIKYFCIFFFAFFQVLSAQIGLPSANDIEEKRKNANLNRTKNLDAPAMPVEVPDSLEVDDLPFPFTNGNDKSLSLPSKIGLKYEYEAETDAYYLANQFGHESMKYALLLNKEEYETYILNQSIKEYYYNKSSLEDKEFQKEEKDKNAFGIKINSKFFKKIFGSDKIIIKPTGFASLDMGMVYQYLDNPQIPKERRGTLNMDLKQTMQFGLMQK